MRLKQPEMFINKIQFIEEFQKKFLNKYPNAKTKDIMPAYVKYLQKKCNENNLTLLFRWAIQDEINEIDNLEDYESVDELGSYWEESIHNTFDYDNSSKYLHFFINYEDKDIVLYNIDDESNPKTHLELWAIDSDIVEEYTGEGEYADIDEYFDEIEEVAIPSCELTSNQLIDTFPIDDERIGSKNYNTIEDSYIRTKKILGDDYENFEDEREF